MEIRAWGSRERLDGGECTSIRLVFAAKGMEGITMRGAQWVVCRALGHQEQECPLPKAQLELPRRNKENLHLLTKGEVLLCKVFIMK